MKKILYIALAATLFAGCSQEDTALQADRTAAQFSKAAITRASGAEWAANDKIGIYMTQAGATSLTGASIVDGAANISYHVVASGKTGTFSPTNTSESIYFPPSGSVDFYAYYPYSATTADGVYKINTSNQTSLPAIDLMTAKVPNQSKSNPSVPFQFAHRLAKVKLTIQAGDGLTAADIANVTVALAGTSPQADCNLLTGAITNPTTAAEISVPQTVNPADASQRMAEAIVIPQNNVADVKLKFNVPAIKTFTASLPSGTTAFEGGKSFLYTVTIARATVTISESDITDWTTNDNGEITTEQAYKIGDYYPDPNVTFNEDKTVKSGTRPIGIVVDLDNPMNGMGTHGKIVSLNESSNFTIWGPADETSANDKYNGLVNMAKIKERDDDFSDYPPFKWVHKMNPSTTTYSANTRGVWYLPSVYEWHMIIRAFNGNNVTEKDPVARSKFNAKLAAAGGDEILEEHGVFVVYYWTSTDWGQNYAYFIEVSEHVGLDGNRYSWASKNDSGSGGAYYRAMYAF